MQPIADSDDPDDLEESDKDFEEPSGDDLSSSEEEEESSPTSYLLYQLVLKQNLF